MKSGPQHRSIGNFASKTTLIAVRRLCGHDAEGPRGVWLQSMERASAPIAPPPASTSVPVVTDIRGS
jgi:hypothetical protein